ncbi:MAG: cyclase family protein [Terriglobia bacterium]|jgi:kynurenine formamidase
MMKTAPAHVSKVEFEKLFERVRNWGRWGPDDERGTLNYITSEQIRKAASLVRSGRSVSMEIPINTVAGPDNPRPAVHYMVQGYDIHSDLGEPQFSTDFLASEFHGDCHTHIDALCHIAYKGKLYNGKPVSAVTTHGPLIQDITAYAHGIVGRGVLLDIPRLRGVKWLEPGEAVPRAELEAAEKAQGVRLGEGDIFVFRTGHHRRRLELGPWNNGYDGEGKAGLHVDTILLLHERKVAAFLPDGDGETVPSNVEGIAYPIHALQIAAMGMACADSLQFEELVKVCEEEKRWEFLVVAAPLRLPRGTGSLFNPIAIF